MDTNYYALHHHMKKAGVFTVIENIFKGFKPSLKDKLFVLYSDRQAKYTPSNKKIGCIVIDDLGYNDRYFENEEQLWKKANELKEKIKSKLDLSGLCVLHCHNISLFKNSFAGAALYLLAKEIEDKKFVLLLQVHDFAEDNRSDRLHLLLNCSGKNNRLLGSKIAYPLHKNIAYLTINSRDKKLLSRIGIPPKRIFVFPNAINTDFFSSKPIANTELKKLIKDYAKRSNYFFDEKRRIILVPMKVMRRKNIVESLLILKLLNSIRDEWQLLITLDANSGEDLIYSERIKGYIRNNNLPVVIGFGFEIISPDENRKYRDGKIAQYNMVDLFSISEAVLTTSTLEGFGFTFLEGWVANKKVIGRSIPFMFKDFEEKGINLGHFYDRIVAGGKDFAKYDHEKQLRLLDKIDYSSLLKQKQVKRIVSFLAGKSAKLIAKNKKKIIENYSIAAYHKRLLDIIAKAESLSHQKLGKIRIDNKYLIEYFKKQK